MSSSGRVYFASDLHLGTPDEATSKSREKLFVKWLDEIKHDAAEIFIVGDIFDFWHEYKTVIPKGFVRIQGQIAEICDSGIPVNVFTGNHDLWMFGYLENELGVKIHRHPIHRQFNGKQFLIGHGDGLGPGDHGYKLVKKIFNSPTCQFFFRWIHPDIGVRIANYFSYKSRYGSNGNEFQLETFKGEENEWLISYCKRKLSEQHFDFFVFGHRHLPLDIQLNDKSRYINTGDWISYNSYAVFDGETLKLKYYK